MSKRHATGARKKLKILAETNSYLRRELIRIEKEVETVNRLAHHDALTGLPNRRLLLDRLNLAVAQAARQKRHVVLVFFDVDGFKAINDKFGHTGGDKLLQGVAQRLCACLRATDTACRYGGDEFIVLLPEVDGEQSAAVVEQKIRTRLAAPHLVDGAMISVTLSIGTAVYPVDDAKDHLDLIKLADAAMYSTRTNGGAALTRFFKAKRRFKGRGVKIGCFVAVRAQPVFSLFANGLSIKVKAVPTNYLLPGQREREKNLKNLRCE